MSKTTKIILIVLGVVTLICLLCVGAGAAYYFYAMNQVKQNKEMFPETIKPGVPAPDFSLSTVNGGSVNLNQFIGRPVILSLGATWCPDCKRELPLLMELHEMNPDLAIIWVDSQEDTKTVKAFVDQYRIPFDVGLDNDGSVARLYHVYAIPTVIFIDRDGMIQSVHIEVLSDEDLLTALEKIGAR